MTFLHLK